MECPSSEPAHSEPSAALARVSTCASCSSASRSFSEKFYSCDPVGQRHALPHLCAIVTIIRVPEGVVTNEKSDCDVPVCGQSSTMGAGHRKASWQCARSELGRYRRGDS